MDLQIILKRFTLYASLTDAEAAPWLPLVSDAAHDVHRMCRCSAPDDAQINRLERAAAALAFYRYTLYRASGVGMEDFRAGDIEVSADKAAAVEFAERVWREEQGRASDLLNDGDFLFRRVGAW